MRPQTFVMWSSHGGVSSRADSIIIAVTIVAVGLVCLFWWLKDRRSAKPNDVDHWKKIIEARGEAGAPNVHGEPNYWGDLSRADDITRWRQIIDESVETKLRAERRKEARANGKAKLAYAAIALALLGGTAGAVAAFRSAIPFGSAASWSAAVSGDPNATQGIWCDNNNHCYIHRGGADYQTDTVQSVMAYACKGDGVTDDSTCFTNAIAALISGNTLYFPAGNYKVTGPFTIGVDNVSLVGSSRVTTTITQGTANTEIFVGSSRTGITVRDLSFVGVAGTTIVTGNTAFDCTTCSDVTLRNLLVTNFKYHSIITMNSNRVNIEDSTFVGNIAWLSKGGTVLKFHHNIVRDPQTPDTTLILPLQFTSIADGGGNNNDVTVTDNTFENWPASQCIEIHNANIFLVSGNLIKNCYIPISINTFTAGDVGQHGEISGNTIVATTSTAYANSQPGINLSGTPGGPVQDILVSDNTMQFGNAAGTVNSDIEGCIVVTGTTDDIHIVGNKLKSCTGNGVSLAGTNTRVTVTGNKITDVVASAGGGRQGISVWNTTGQTGYIGGNDIDGTINAIRIDVSSNFSIGWNNITNATTRIFGRANATIMQFADGLSATGSQAIDFSGSSGTFATPTGVNTFGGSTNNFTNQITIPAGTGTQTGNAPLTVFKNATPVPSVTSGEIDGQSYTMPANTLAVDGQMVSVHYGFTHAANTNSTTAKSYFNGSLLSATTVTGSSNLVEYVVYITRTSSSTARIYSLINNGNGGATAANLNNITSLNFGSSIIIKNSVTGATTNGDLTAQYARMEWWP